MQYLRLIFLVAAIVTISEHAVCGQMLSIKLKAEGAAALAKAAQQEGNSVRGAILFPQQRLQCATCHAAGSTNLLGPDLTQLGGEVTGEYLIEAILEPTKVIAKDYESVIVTTTDGRTITGRVIQKAATQLVLREAEVSARLITLGMDEIEAVTPNKVSAMPVDLADQLANRQEFLDLVKYLMEIAATGTRTNAEQIGNESGGGTIPEDLQGLVLLDELNCFACHASESQLADRSSHHGPDLKWSGQHIDPLFIERFIADPAGVKPSTTMPDMMGDRDANSRQEIARSITHYLISLSEPVFAQQAPDRIAAARGRALFHSVGCVACHSPRGGQGREGLTETSVALGRLHDKYDVDGLIAFLENPRTARPAGRMPNMQLSHWEAHDIANYLLQNTRVTGPLRYTIYEGDMHEGLDRLTGKAKSAGIVDGFSLKPFDKYRQDFAIRFEGFLEVPESGRYTFFLKCNDGGRLIVDGKPRISLPPQAGIQAQSRQTEVALTARRHRIQLDYLQIKGDAVLDLQWEGPNLTKRPVPTDLLRSDESTELPNKPYRWDRSLAAKGQQHFRKLGCVQCHDVGRADDDREYPVLTVERTASGCLSGQTGTWPRYHLNDSQRRAIRAALGRNATTLSDDERIAVTMTRLRCVACHQRGELGGVPLERDEYFQTVDPNLGPQGRIPPQLTGIGAKLKPQWMHDVLVNGRAIRPYMQTRMPQFGAANVAHLVELFARVDQLPTIEFGEFKDHREARKVGVELVGNKGLNCVACHTFQLKAAQTMSAVDLTEMADRLLQNWFYQFMRDPQRLNPRTVMPSFWPGGRAIRQDILGGDASQQIEGLWQYLQDGRQARTPRGLVAEPIELVASNEAVMLRRSYAGIGKRGVGVGYPHGVNLAFDAEQMRLAMIWKGKFADPGSVWRGQGSGNVRPLGERPLQFVQGPDLDDANAPWIVDDGRPPKHQFTGYYLDQLRRPTFTYRFERVEVEDYPIDVQHPENNTAFLRRTLTIRADQRRDNLVFRVASGDNVRRHDAGTFLVGEKLRVRIDNDHKAQIVDTLTGQNLVVPLVATKNEATLVIDYVW